MKTVLVCGGRDFARVPKDNNGQYRDTPEWEKFKKQYNFVFRTLDQIICYELSWVWDTEYMMPAVRVVNGGADGADKASTDWAVVNWCMFNEVPANWNLHGKKAGPIRNAEMLKDYDPDLIIAFPGGKGTKHMVDIATKAGKKVIQVQYHE